MRLPRTITPDAKGVDAKPRVLLADDHVQVLETVAGLLAADFDIVGAVSDGRQALDLSLRLNPDIVVLDVKMPELDGFQTLQELRRVGSHAKVVLLTMQQADAYVTTAISSGAQGYVLKTRIHSDLTGAIDHALAGRLFVPSLTSLSAVVGSGHTAQFHMNDPVFLDEVSQFVGSTLRSGESIVVAATDHTRTGIAHRLIARGMDLAAMTAQGQYVVLDAAESLSQFMRDGQPDADCLADIVGGLERLRLSSARGPQSRLTIFGEMAVLLCRNGHVEAAVEVERIWSDLTRPLPFLTVCSYPIECFQDERSQRLFSSVCAEHWAVSHTALSLDKP
jgi:DNA-binding NarL/FixJ family response regulator